CQARAGACVAPGAATSCLIEGECVAAGKAPVPCLTCQPATLALEWTPAAAGSACSTASCENNVFTAASSCDAFGVCQPAVAQDCGPFVCTDTGCPLRCTGDADCLAPNVCGNSICTAPTLSLPASARSDAGPSADDAPARDEDT